MDVISASFRVSSWKNVEELRSVYDLIYNESSSVDDKKKAYLMLQSWKVRRSQETLTGILCTLSLLDVHIKDITEIITDPFTLSTLYASTLTKFINFASSFLIHEKTMYRSAEKLGIDSFLVDLRHMCAHGKQLPSLEVFRKSHRYCLNWIKMYFWEHEMSNVSDATSIEIRYDATLGSNLRELFTFYDSLAELLHKNVVKFADLAPDDSVKERWPTINMFMKQNKLNNFRHAYSFLTNALFRIIESKMMSQNPRTFFHEMFERCDYFMQVTDKSDGASVEVDNDDSYMDVDEGDESFETEASPTKSSKREPASIVNLFQKLIWQIAKHDYLKLFLDMLYQISLNENETPTRRASSRFWITIVLGSFRYYQRYCEFSKTNAILQTKIDQEICNIFSYQFDADLKKVFIFVGTQLLPTSLKYSREFFMQLLNNIDAESENICVSLLPFVYPSLTPEQLKEIESLIDIGTNRSRKIPKVSEDKVYSVEDLLLSNQMKSSSNDPSSQIWTKSLDNIDWSVQPIGKDFSINA